MKRLALVGGGKLNTIVAKACADGLLEEYELVGVLSRTPESAEKVAAIGGCPACRTLEELLALKPDYVAEAASVQTVKDIAVKVLSSGADLIPLSCGAFADSAFLQQVKDCAAANGTKVHIPSGAIGGFDVMQTLSIMAQAGDMEKRAEFRTEKASHRMQGTPLYRQELMDEAGEAFSGTASEAIALLPGQVNVAVAAAMATLGPDNTQVRIRCIPDYVGDDHRITVELDGYRAVLGIYSAKSDIAGWSVVALLRNLASPISCC